MGWAIGDGQNHGEDPTLDGIEAEALYDLLEQKVIPEFYTRNASDIPVAWVNRIRESMARTDSTISTNRSVREYTEQYYLPAALLHNGSLITEYLLENIVNWEYALKDKWAKLRFGEVMLRHKMGSTCLRFRYFLMVLIAIMCVSSFMRME